MTREARRDGTRGPGPAGAAGLAAAAVAAMSGVVFAANPARYGLAGVLIGILLIGAGAVAAVRIFRAAR